MPGNENPDEHEATSRRQVLKRASAAALAGVGLASGTAAAGVETDGHCDCYHEYRCETDLLCQEPTGDYWYMRQSRECCDCDGDGTYDCSDWTNDNVCCSG